MHWPAAAPSTSSPAALPRPSFELWNMRPACYTYTVFYFTLIHGPPQAIPLSHFSHSAQRKRSTDDNPPLCCWQQSCLMQQRRATGMFPTFFPMSDPSASLSKSFHTQVSWVHLCNNSTLVGTQQFCSARQRNGQQQAYHTKSTRRSHTTTVQQQE